MFIQTEQTPNPSTLKFLPGRVVMARGTMDFATADTAKPSPLAKRLFAVEGVERVFLGSDFVTVTKAVDRDWLFSFLAFFPADHSIPEFNGIQTLPRSLSP